MSSTSEIASAFIQGAPPGELQDVVNDIQTLTSDTDPSLLSRLKPAFQKYNEEQLATTKLPGSGKTVLISRHNRLEDGRYFDTESKTSFEFDHITQKASSPQPYTPSSPNQPHLTALNTALKAHASEHYPASTYGVYPVSPTNTALVLVSNKYSPQNFWNGRWRSVYEVSTENGTTTKITGKISVTVHYYEDGNVSLSSTKTVSLSLNPSSSSSSSSSATDIIRAIASAEKTYQIELNRGFLRMNEDGFKALRRQLPVSRQKVEWEKVGGYRLGSDLKGAGRG